MRQQQTIILEKSDIQKLKSGEALSITLSNGNSVEIIYHMLRRIQKEKTEPKKNPNHNGYLTADETRKFLISQNGATVEDLRKAFPGVATKMIQNRITAWKLKGQIKTERGAAKQIIYRMVR